jgi:predicted SAM-dependent methyltransferase
VTTSVSGLGRGLGQEVRPSRILRRIIRDPRTRYWIKQLPGVFHARRLAMRLRRIYYRRLGVYQLQLRVRRSSRLRIVIGAWDRYDPGWIPTQCDYLNLLIPGHWSRVFQPNSVDAMLAEHVWEHITEDEGRRAAQTCYGYLKPGGYLRVAVPDGFHPDPRYIDEVKPGAVAVTAGNAENHSALYTYRSLSRVFEDAGFRVVLCEYFDEQGQFHSADWDRSAGTIWRSRRFDPVPGRPFPSDLHQSLSYSSLMLDAVKDP